MNISRQTTVKKIITLTSIFLLAVQLFGQDYKNVNTGRLNVRENAGKQYRVVGQVNKGDKVAVISESNNWIYVETETGLRGYVASEYLSPIIITEKNNDKEQKDKEQKDSSWAGTLLTIGILVAIAYKAKNIFTGLFGGVSSSTSSQKKSTTKPSSQHNQIDTFHLTIKDGIVYLGKEKSTMKHPIFNYVLDKAIDCELEDPKDERSRYLVVTAKGEILLCKLKSTGRDFVYKPFVLYGSAYRARFSDSNSFTFTTEKGTYKGYFNSNRKDKL